MRALCLFGGGRNGSFEDGVLNGPQLAGAKYDIVGGVSTGAIGAAMLACLGLKGMDQRWVAITGTGCIYGNKDTLGIPVNEVADMIFGGGCGIYNHGPIQALIEKWIVPPLSLDCAVEYVDLGPGGGKQIVVAHLDGTFTGVPELPKGFAWKDFQKAVLASAMTPGLVDGVDGHMFDGGCMEMGPVEFLIKSGATEIDMILCDPYTPKLGFVGNPGDALGTVLRALQAVLHSEMLADVQVAIDAEHVNFKLFAPSTDLGDAANFDPKAIETNRALGAAAFPILARGLY